MKALILAAGFGSRLMPLTQHNPKCMVEYQGRKILDYEITALREAGISKIAVVGGYLFEVLSTYLQSNFAIKDIYYNPSFNTSNMVKTLFCAREWIESCIKEKEDLIVSYADIVYFKESVCKLQSANAPLSVVIDKQWRRLWEQRFSNPLEDAETLKIVNGKIVELGKKAFSYEEIEGQYIGLFKFSYGFLPEVLSFYDTLDRKATYEGKDFDNMYMTSFLQALIDNFHNAEPVEIYGNWCEIDFKSDLEIKI
ncbi:phosphocholine cytidylyltransferase family protein [Helicobacter apodemus]|uniref:Phosphocholine cytidylyltransferase family protein n=1 Tax=Helicobacter apodemus TaxID=135569 RepID=A0A4U8UDP7_9HELI|nr:phosphocholine cytidylyltransferase family protein [Helicobacter apodemus]TLE15981.1 phosphocholine cytidylyltransferase family protein [Helicobacter apodemus]